MPLIINNIRGELGEETGSVIKRALKRAGISEYLTVKTGIYKTSLDARKRGDIHFVHSVYAAVSYTHLDVYKRQAISRSSPIPESRPIFKSVSVEKSSTISILLLAQLS